MKRNNHPGYSKRIKELIKEHHGIFSEYYYDSRIQNNASDYNVFATLYTLFSSGYIEGQEKNAIRGRNREIKLILYKDRYNFLHLGISFGKGKVYYSISFEQYPHLWTRKQLILCNDGCLIFRQSCSWDSNTFHMPLCFTLIKTVNNIRYPYGPSFFKTE